MSGCQQMVQQKAPVTPSVQAENQFQLQGKIGVRTPQQSGSAFFTWVQQQEEFDIELTGILGAGKTQISGTPGR
jgi:Outer membrane lipoprotein involved in outer membrane biogenesis